LLLSKEVEIGLGSKNIKYYEELGYFIPRIINKKGKLAVVLGSKIKVSISDLPNATNVLVDVKCDSLFCEHPFLKPRWYDYLKGVKEDDTYYCKKCASILYGNENSRLTRLKNGKSFEQWCIDNNRQDILLLWDYDLNYLKPSEISYCSKKEFYFKCSQNLHPSEIKKISNITCENVLNCNMCNSFGQFLVDSYGENTIDLYWSKLNKISPWEISKCCNDMFWLKCQNKIYHEDYLVSCGNFSSHSSRCPYCENMKINSLDSLGTLFPKTINVWSHKNDKTPFEYSPWSNELIWWKCLDGIHKDYLRAISDSNKCEFRCPDCNKESILQEKTNNYLNEFDYTIFHEYNCTIFPTNPKTKYRLPFDNEIVELKLIIEVHGIQHYQITNFANMSAKKNNTTPKYELHYQKLKDRYKRIFAKSRGYFYLEIPYWADDKKETWKKLIDEKIKEILSI